jgi:hypothetical protein
VWVTQGRYIESYIPRDVLAGLLNSLYSEKSFTDNTDSYSDVLRPQDKSSTWRPDKVKLAKEVCKRWQSGLDYLDLYDRVLELTQLVEHANGYESPPARPAKLPPEFTDA